MKVNIALLTVTDTRTFDNDKSGAILVKKIKLANHNLLDRKICKDNKNDIVLILKEWIKKAIQILKHPPTPPKNKHNKSFFFSLMRKAGAKIHFFFVSFVTLKVAAKGAFCVTNNQPLFILFYYCFLDKKVLAGGVVG